MPEHPSAPFFVARPPLSDCTPDARTPVIPTRDAHRDKLREEVLRSRRALQRFRDARKTLVQDYAGDFFGEQVGPLPSRRVVVNLIQRAVSTYVLLLSANRPRAKVTTEYRKLLPFARTFDVSLNGYLKTIPIASVIQECVREACFSMGVARVGVLPAGAGEYGDPGRPGVEAISFDDWVHDVQARCWERRRYCGHYYESDIEELKADDTLDRRQLGKITPGRRRGLDGTEADPVKDIETQGEWDEYDGTVTLIDLWLPRERKLVTFDAEFKHLLRVLDWEGPARGPYHVLRFDRIPDTIMGLPVAHQLKPLFDLMNSIWRKLSRQGKNQKRNPVFSAGNEKDALAIKRAADGEWVGVNSIDAIGVHQSPGIDGALATFGVQVEDEFNRESGNTEHLGGLGPSAGTYGQEKIIQGNVSQRLGKMQSEVADFTRDLVSDIGFWLWRDEVLTLAGAHEVEVPGLAERVSVPFEWTPGDREGDYLDYNFDIDPYSMAYRTPEEQAAVLTQVVTGLIAPLLPYMQEQGVGVDFNALLEAVAQLQGVPSLRDVIVPQAPPSNEKPGPLPGKPPVTQRNYTRRNVSTGGTPAGRRSAFAGAYSGTATPQQAQTVQTPA